MKSPVIETARLRLRLHAPVDLEPRTAMLLEEETMRHIGGAAADYGAAREDCWARIQRYVGHWALFGWGIFAVEDKATSQFVGEAGIADFHRGLGPDFDATPEGAWVLRQAAAGRGYASEAMTAALEWFVSERGAQRIVCIIDPLNLASIRVAQKLGFAAYDERAYHGAPKLLFERLP
ncbi:RimJ/RimL family protein N-acetyltransferase [Sphingomonas vulcanisoli]|uniref:RimJ/RimL family protein N-acetyltransferase n=1 Tax=Sphingomonas vulcanisoli TaxID=1658060 RepID=A0ABX0TWQ4_9SPHN|nr:GNAT family N-acetyltransferase [Sphingomonas vulcanisoli]NIJ08847.1 RimJ/RimL family protein N-acetyltransferase [Sphingomonas vulcanisoli]